MPFPPDFLWGVATSSYQIEGASREDGRGETIWDRFSHQPGNVERGETGDVACDHYHRYEDDIDLMSELGIRAYRFSIAWSRLFPEGDGQLNLRGLDFYERLVDRLLARGITPVPTLYHWDLPQALQDRHGGWASRETSGRFADYAVMAMTALGDRVSRWITLNEPWVSAFLGYRRGVHAPGVRDMTTALRAAHHLLLAHGRAVEAYRSLGQGGEIGITLDLQVSSPETDSEADRTAARDVDSRTNRWFLDPVLRGSYPGDALEAYVAQGADLDFIEGGDLDVISGAIDFLGVNYYFRRLVGASVDEFGERAGSGDDAETTAMGWGVDPDGLTEQLARLRRDYPPIPIYITENGTAMEDVLGPDGTVLDPRRIDYLRRHFASAERAIEEGTDLRGYFVWSFLDNFEWAYGYRPRFGLVYVDFETQRRIPKASARWYAGVIAANGLDRPAQAEG